MTAIDPRVQEALDGERDPTTLPAELREAYARLTAAATLLRDPPATSVADRVMAQIRREAPATRPPRSNMAVSPAPACSPAPLPSVLIAPPAVAAPPA